MTGAALEKAAEAIHQWLHRHEEERVPLSTKVSGTYPEPQSKKVKNMLLRLKAEARAPRASAKGGKGLRGRVEAAKG